MTREDRERTRSRPPRVDLTWAARLVGSEGVDQLRIHLGDLYVACGDVMQKIERINASAESAETETVRRTLAQLEAQLYEHILPHLEQLKPTLNKLTSRLYSEAERESGGL